MRAAAAPSCLVVDTSTPLRAADVLALSRAVYKGEAIRGIGRYVSLRSPNFVFDISAKELEAITDPANDEAGTGLGCWLTQHVRYGVGSQQNPDGWVPSAQIGSFDGMTARRHASVVGYPAGAHLTLDMEGVNPATAHSVTTAHCESWSESVTEDSTSSPVFPPMLYDGYSPGLSAEEMWELPEFHAYWGPSSSPNIPHRGYVMRQIALDVVLGGVKVDISRVMTDALGGTLMWCVAGEPLNG